MSAFFYYMPQQSQRGVQQPRFFQQKEVSMSYDPKILS